MVSSWLTQSNLGTHAVGQAWLEDSGGDPSVNQPLLIAYLAPVSSVISLVSGSLPPGLSWVASPNWITVTGVISSTVDGLIHSWTFRITEPGGTTLDRTFEMQVSMRPVPEWVTPGDLGTFPETRSFNLDPLYIAFNSDSRVAVSLLNGQLPPGLTWARSGSQIKISGESQDISGVLESDFTLRLTNTGGKVADRTFRMALIPAAQLPDWSDQSPDLGLTGSGRSSTFRVQATASTSIYYSLLDPVPPGMTIDPRSGEIRYQSPVISSDTTVEFPVRARTGSAYNDLACRITVLTIPHAPVWITPPDAIRISQRRYLELKLEAFDPMGTPLMYLMVSSSPGFPFSLDGDGLLYGIAPPVSEDTTYSLVIKATTDPALLGPTVSTDQEFEITVLRTNTVGVLDWNSNVTDLLGVLDGRIVTFDCGANSDRTVTVLHSVTGGQLPRGLILGATTGMLHGFLEYHPVNKDYWFDIRATDGVDSLMRTMRFQVISSTDHAHISVSLPLTGDIKDAWLAQNHALVGDGSSLVNVSVGNNQFTEPALLLVDGLGSALDDPDRIITAVDPWCQQMELRIGPISNVAVNGDQLISRQVLDPQAGASSIVYRDGILPDPLYPASLQNLRQAFIDRCGFESGGDGTAAAALLFIDLEDGSINQALVTNAGTGYKSSPVVSVSGTGTGADIRARMGLRTIKVIDPGQGWQVGDQIPLDVGANDRPATVVVSDITARGGIARALITDPGSYSRVPEIKIFIAGRAGSMAGIELDLEIDLLEILDPGQGYGTDATLSFSGAELLPDWASAWSPEIPVIRVRAPAAELMLRQADSDPDLTSLDGRAWSVDTVIMTAQGSYWQGTTRFDDGVTSFDGDTSRFQETVDPRQTLIDRGTTTWDVGGTTLDQGDQARVDVQESWGRTVIDGGMTAFDFYAVVFDPMTVSPSDRSSTQIQRIVHLRRPM